MKMDTGIACLDGYIFTSSEDLEGRYHPLYLQTAHPTMPRIDRIILRLDRNIAARSITPCVLLGTAAALPKPADLTRDNSIYEISLAAVRVGAGMTIIRSSDITDERFNNECCGLMHSILGLDSSEWQKQFDTFLASIKQQDSEFLIEQTAEFNRQTEQRRTAFDMQLEAQKIKQGEFTAEERAWFASVQAELPSYAGFSFDNQWLYPDSVKETNTATLAMTLKSTEDGSIYAESSFTANPDGSLSETLRVYADGGNTVLWQRTRTTSFGDTIKEVVS